MDEVQSITEIWKDVAGYEGRYRVSNLGRVFSIYSEIFLKFKLDRYGYHVATLVVSRHSLCFTVHKLVCIAFHGPKPSPTHQVNHIDGVKTHNYWCNLEWATPKENYDHAVRLGLIIPGNGPNQPRGERSKRAKITAKAVEEIRDSAMGPKAAVELSQKYGITKNYVYNLRSRVSWKHLP